MLPLVAGYIAYAFQCCYQIAIFINNMYLLSTYTHKYNIAHLYMLIYSQDHQMAPMPQGAAFHAKFTKPAVLEPSRNF